MLKHLRVRGFKSFVDASVEVAPFTLLVGANATGKSNLLDALRFLHGLAQGWSCQETVGGHTSGTSRIWDGIRGGTNGLTRLGCDKASIESDWQILGDYYRHSICTNGSTVLKESLGNLFESTAGLSDHETDWSPASGVVPGQRPMTWPNDKSVLTSPLASANPFISPLRHTLASIRFEEFQPSLMRDYSERPGSSHIALTASGSNLSGYLWHLCKDEKVRQGFIEWLVEFCAPEITDLEFEETESGYVMLRVVESDGTKTPARSMSDGTLQFLAMLATLHHANHTIVIEDIDAGLHPSRLRLLIEAIRTQTQPRLPDGHAPVLVATTHSAALVEEALQVEHARVVLCARAPEDGGGSILRDVRSLPNFDEVLRRRDFAYLVNTGWLERSL